MAYKVFKYEVNLGRVGSVGTVMPQGARILSVQVQPVDLGLGAHRNVVMLWALVDENAKQARRLITGYDTGLALPNGDPGKFIGTVQLQGGALVLHFFDEGEARD